MAYLADDDFDLFRIPDACHVAVQDFGMLVLQRKAARPSDQARTVPTIQVRHQLCPYCRSNAEQRAFGRPGFSPVDFGKALLDRALSLNSCCGIHSSMAQYRRLKTAAARMFGAFWLANEST